MATDDDGQIIYLSMSRVMVAAVIKEARSVLAAIPAEEIDIIRQHAATRGGSLLSNICDYVADGMRKAHERNGKYDAGLHLYYSEGSMRFTHADYMMVSDGHGRIAACLCKEAAAGIAALERIRNN
jgi:hypothetical protein